MGWGGGGGHCAGEKVCRITNVPPSPEFICFGVIFLVICYSVYALLKFNPIPVHTLRDYVCNDKSLCCTS